MARLNTKKDNGIPKAKVEEVEEIEVDPSIPELSSLDFSKAMQGNEIQAIPGISAFWWALSEIGRALTKGYTLVVGHDTPYLVNPTQYQLVPNLNYLTSDGGKSVIVVCKTKDYKRQVEERAAKYCESILPKNIEKETIKTR